MSWEFQFLQKNSPESPHVTELPIIGKFLPRSIFQNNHFWLGFSLNLSEKVDN